MVDVNIDNIAPWLKSWFYDKLEIDTKLNGKSNTSHSHNIFGLNQMASDGNMALEEEVDVDGSGMAIFNSNLVYCSNEDRVYYRGDGGDPDYEIATKGDIQGGGGGGSITVDSALSSSSTNPVQNKVINTALNGKAPTSHSSSNNTYGIGTTSNYGHNKVINDLTHSSFNNGESLSAYQGYLLDQDIATLDNTVQNLEYDDIGGNFVDSISGIQAVGLKQIIEQIVGVINTLNPPSVEQQSITVTSPTSGTNYFNGGTREITAVKYGKVVQVYVNFYNVSAKQGTTSTDTVIGTLPNGWEPIIGVKIKPAINVNSSGHYVQMGVNSNGNVILRLGSTTTMSSATFRGTMTFITA